MVTHHQAVRGNEHRPERHVACPRTVQAGEPTASVQRHGRATPDGSSIARYAWDLDGDGQLRDGRRRRGLRHAIGGGVRQNGVHPVNLRVTDNCGGTDRPAA